MRTTRTLLIVVVLLCLLGAVGFFGFKTYNDNVALQKRIDTMSATIASLQEQLSTAAKIASKTTVLCPSYLTYAQQTALEKGTGLAGVDFLYVEKKTGIDALTLFAIAVHESSVNGNPGTNYWAKTYNNVMSLGITAENPDRTYYSSKTMNVLITAQWLARAYLSTDGLYYHGGLTQWDIGKSYASDGSWATGVTNALAKLEKKLTELQRMKRWCTSTTLFTPDVTWDYEHLVTGWALFKTNNATVVAGR